MTSPTAPFPPLKARKQSKDQSPSSLVTPSLPPRPPRYPRTSRKSVSKDSDLSDRSIPGQLFPSNSNAHDLNSDAVPPSASHFHYSDPNFDRYQADPSRSNPVQCPSSQLFSGIPVNYYSSQLSSSKQTASFPHQGANPVPPHQSPSSTQSGFLSTDQIASSAASFPISAGLSRNHVGQERASEHLSVFSSAEASGNQINSPVPDCQQLDKLPPKSKADFDHGSNAKPTILKGSSNSISNNEPESGSASHPEGNVQHSPHTASHIYQEISLLPEVCRATASARQEFVPPFIDYRKAKDVSSSAYPRPSAATPVTKFPHSCATNLNQLRTDNEPSVPTRAYVADDQPTCPSAAAPSFANPSSAGSNPDPLLIHPDSAMNAVHASPDHIPHQSYGAPGPSSYARQSNGVDTEYPSPNLNAENLTSNMPSIDEPHTSSHPVATDHLFHQYDNGFPEEYYGGISPRGPVEHMAGSPIGAAADYSLAHSTGSQSQFAAGSPSGHIIPLTATMAEHSASEDLSQMQRAATQPSGNVAAVSQDLSEFPPPDPNNWNWQRLVQEAQSTIESDPQLQHFSSLVAKSSPVSDNPLCVEGVLYEFGSHHPREIMAAFGFPKTDRDAEYCVENTPGLSKENFEILEKTILSQVRAVRIISEQAVKEMENVFIMHMFYRVITEGEVYLRFSHLINSFIEARECIVEKYRCYVRNLRAIENVSTRQRRGCLEHRQNNIMRRWLYKHFGNPYPEGSHKKQLVEETGLKGRQVNNWFINARSRIWRPTVEGMSREILKQAADMLYEDRYAKVKRKPKIELENGKRERNASSIREDVAH